MDSSSVTQWIAQATGRDEQVAGQIVQHYYERLVRLARRKMIPLPPQVADEEGAVVSAFRSFFSGMERNQFADLQGRDDLWKVLATITARKSIAQLRRHWKQSGEGGHVDHGAEIAQLLDRSPTPDQVAALIDECKCKIDALDDVTLRQIALLRLEGQETRQIAEELDVHQRTVQRKLSYIESLWFAEEADE